MQTASCVSPQHASPTTPPRKPRASPSLALPSGGCYGRELVMTAGTPERAPADEAALVAAMARGETQALAQLYDIHAPLMLAVAQRILGTRNAAEDLVHDVLLEAWQHANEYDAARGTVRAWLLLRTRSRSLDVKKSARIARSVSFSESIVDMSSDAEQVLLAPDQRRVQNLLARLPDEQRTVLLLGYFEGLSSSEIAARINVPIGTVKSRVAAALTRLRTALSYQELR
jgi:RNA polymerase sigma-70 factor (ECF subfamily)